MEYIMHMHMTLLLGDNGYPGFPGTPGLRGDRGQKGINVAVCEKLLQI